MLEIRNNYFNVSGFGSVSIENNKVVVMNDREIKELPRFLFEWEGTAGYSLEMQNVILHLTGGDILLVPYKEIEDTHADGRHNFVDQKISIVEALKDFYESKYESFLNEDEEEIERELLSRVLFIVTSYYKSSWSGEKQIIITTIIPEHTNMFWIIQNDSYFKTEEEDI
ncbi:MAG: hypothetical protein QXP36_05150 [Conexivisphaerales archaeon]